MSGVSFEASVETGEQAVSKSPKRIRKSDVVATNEGLGKVGKGTCQECGGEYFKIDLYGGGGYTIRCSHCGEDWPGQF
jgi:hypothetical protein